MQPFKTNQSTLVQTNSKIQIEMKTIQIEIIQNGELFNTIWDLKIANKIMEYQSCWIYTNVNYTIQIIHYIYGNHQN